MARYVDGYVLPLAKKHVARYRRIARKAGDIWMEHGALEYRECVGDDLRVKGMRSFLTMAGAKTGHTVVFSWVVYRSRAHRDRVNAKVMKDPRIQAMIPDVPFNPKSMAYGGFRTLVDL